MAWTETDKDNLKKAIATGATEVTYSDGTSVTYRSLRDMRTTLALIESELSSSTKRTKTVRFNSSKGY